MSKKLVGGGGDEEYEFNYHLGVAQAAADQAVQYALQLLDAAILEDQAIHASEVSEGLRRAHKERTTRAQTDMRNADRALSGVRREFETISQEYTRVIQRTSNPEAHHRESVAVEAKLSAAQAKLSAAQAKFDAAQDLHTAYSRISDIASDYHLASVRAQAPASQVVASIRALAHAKTIDQRQTAEERLVVEQARVAPANLARAEAHAAFIAASQTHPLRTQPREPPARNSTTAAARVFLELSQAAQAPARVRAAAQAALTNAARANGARANGSRRNNLPSRANATRSRSRSRSRTPSSSPNRNRTRRNRL